MTVPDAGDSGAGALPVAACGTVDATASDVRVVPKEAGAPSYVDAAPPDGVYDLVQATSYGASPFTSLRATMRVVGGAIFFGGQATTGALEGNESFVLAWAPGSVTKICGSSAGTLATSLFPGDPGAKRAAHVVWDAGAKLLTFEVEPDFASYELVFSAR